MATIKVFNRLKYYNYQVLMTSIMKRNLKKGLLNFIVKIILKLLLGFV